MDNVILQEHGLPLPGLIPPAEQNIPAIMAEEFFTLPDARSTRLEGTCFGPDGMLYFVDIDYDLLYRLDVDQKQLTTLYTAPGAQFSAVKVRADGRLFVCCLNPEIGMFTLATDGSDYCPVDILRGYVIDDMVFDRKGGFYFTELVGEFHAPTGRVCYVDASLQNVATVVDGLASPNGLALSPDETVLWVTETTGGRLMRFELSADGMQVAPYGSYPAYHFIGKPGPDSCSLDDGILYVALYRQGRFMAFQEDGYPIGQILLPGREKGRNLYSTHCKLRPGTQELYLCASSGPAGTDAAIFRADVATLRPQ